MQIIARDVDLQYVGFEIACAAEMCEHFLVVLGQFLSWERGYHPDKKDEAEYSAKAKQFHECAPQSTLLR